MAYVFTAMESQNRCFIPGCDGKETKLEADYVNYAIPSDLSGNPRKCEIYEFKNDTHSTDTCLSEHFVRDQVRHCDSFIFKHDGSIAKEYDLLCENDVWKLSLVGSCNTFGMLLGMWVTGYISDSYGRKVVLIFGMTLGGIVGISKSFAPNFQLFCFFEFIEAFMESGSHLSIFLIAMELVTPGKRLWIGCVFFSFCSFGQMFLAMVAWIVYKWRFIIYIIYGPTIFFLLLYPFIMESMRWQLSRGDIDRAKKTLNKIAKSNGKSIPPSYFFTLQRNFIENREKIEHISLIQLVKSRVLLVRFTISAFIWTVCALLFYGLSLSSVSLTGNSYLNFIFISIVEIPAYILIALVAEKIGRKVLLVGSFFLTAISCILYIFCGGGSGWFLLILNSIGKFGAAGAFNIMYMMTSEMFPTPLRHTTVALLVMIGRIGSLISPQVSLMDMLWVPLPNVIFASMASMAGLLSLLLPETIGIKLPDTIEEAELIGKKGRERKEIDNLC